MGGGLGTLKSSSVTIVADQKSISATVGALVLNDVKLSGTFAFAGGGGGARGGSNSGGSQSGSFNTSTFTVTGVDPSDDSLGVPAPVRRPRPAATRLGGAHA